MRRYDLTFAALVSAITLAALLLMAGFVAALAWHVVFAVVELYAQVP